MEFGCFQNNAWIRFVPRESAADAGWRLVNGAPLDVAVVEPESGAALLCTVLIARRVVVLVESAELVAAEVAQVVVGIATQEAELRLVVFAFRVHQKSVVCHFIFLQHSQAANE